ncbi:hypothetical protein GN157_09855 [Flavobacterium rakeshii]|uniref:DUF3137 domain-containing protein n=1 Tax=Flavobacterium rakeshii TaxID=1038845 RepID=A0A6N8HCP8_9FLAO|nr:hypothetical protein [Flavobacterium rakeshii]MUV04012.1 hypothetical protein [Flavobacterium rakeshii]
MKPEKWNEFAQYINGEYIKNSAWHSAKTIKKYKGHSVIFDNYTTYQTVSNTTITQVFTRLTIPLNINYEFSFEIYRKNLITSIGKLFGMQDIEVGHTKFDRDFIIKSNNGFKIKQILNNKEVRESIEQFKGVYITTSKKEGIFGKKLPKSKTELTLYTYDDITDFEMLKAFYDLLTILTDKLESMDYIKTEAI